MTLHIDPELDTQQTADAPEHPQSSKAHAPASGVANPVFALIAGLLAAASALGVGELLAGLSRRTPSLIRAIGDVFVDWTPGSVVRASIENLGSSQKPALLWGIGITAVAIGGLLGLLSKRHNRPGIIGFALFGIAGAWAASRVPLTSTGQGVLSAILATAVGLGVFLTLMRFARAAEAPTPASTEDTTFVAGSEGTVEGASLFAPDGDNRRAFLGFAGLASVWGVFGIGFGRWLKGRQSVEGARQEVATRISEATVTSAPATPLADVSNLDGDVPGISQLFTPNDEFYRIDTALSVPQIDPNEWYMEIKGMVDQTLRFTLDDLLAMEQMESDVTLSCVSNEVGGVLVGNARWTGVRLSTLLDMAGVDPAATQIASRSWDGWDCGFPTEVAFDGRDAMVALTMNGEPLPIIHGFPARLVIPGLYGYVSATKWLKEIELTTLEGFDGYWIPRGWGKFGPIKTQSRIDVPRRGETIAAGTNAIAGVAWAGIRAVSRVEVSVNGGEWLEAQLGDELAEQTWRQWVLAYDFVPGDYTIAVRATDGDGMTQGSQRRPVAPDGAEGHHTISVRVN